VLDTSSSVEGRRLDELRIAAHAFLAGLTARDRGALVTFTQQVTLRQPPTADREALRRALDGIDAGGSTAMNDALYTALRLLEPGLARQVVVVFSDGRDNQSWLSDDAMVEAARRSDAVVYGVTAFDRAAPWRRDDRLPPEYEALGRAAETTGGRIWRETGPETLRRAFLAVLDEIRTRYVIAYYPTAPVQPGWHDVKVKLTRTRGDVRTRAGYYVHTALP